jgi:hypothetical protein
LIVDPNKRLSAQQALKHKWFVKMAEGKLKTNIVMNKDVLQRLQSFRGVSKLKKAAMNILVKMADQN